MAGEALVAPSHLHVEVSSVLRRAVLSGRIGCDVGALAHQDLVQFAFPRSLSRHSHRGCGELHPNVSAHDAAYVALAEELSVPLLTLDRRLSRSEGPTCSFRLPQGGSNAEAPGP